MIIRFGLVLQSNLFLPSYNISEFDEFGIIGWLHDDMPRPSLLVKGLVVCYVYH